MTDYSKIARLIIGEQNRLNSLPPNPIDTVFLFGAGASYGCGKVFPYSPPLGFELYHRLSKEFPESWGMLSHELDNLFSVEFELGMRVLWEDYTDISRKLLKEMGVYFSRFKPYDQSITLYRKLVQRLIRRNKDDVLLTTLNYDCLLDGELTKAGLGVNYMFEEGGSVPLVKLHGSCNWFVDIPTINQEVNIGSSVWIDAKMFSLSSPDEVRSHLNGNSLFQPVFCLYTIDKPAPLCNNFFQFIQSEWKKKVLMAKQIAIIGVKPYLRDKHIWDPLAETKARILFIGEKEAYKKWHIESGRRSETQFVSEHFDKGFDQIWNQLFY